MIKEIRSTSTVSSVEDNQKMIIEGKAIAFDSPTTIRGMGAEFTEVISRSAMDNCDMSDCCLKYNHSNDIPVLARVRGNSLQIEVKEDGVYFRAELFNTSAARDCFELVKQEALQCSFSFYLDEEDFTYDSDTRTRTINNISKLYDLAIVDIPAYKDTYVHARSAFYEQEAQRQLELAKAKFRYEVKKYGFT